MAIEDAERLLKQISDSLKGPEATTVGQLISEVRDAIRGSGQNTVRMAINDMQKAVTTELSLLREAYRTGGGGPAHPGTPGQPAGGRFGQENQASLQLMERIATKLDDIENVMAVVAEGIHHGVGSGGGGGTPFDFRYEMQRYRDMARNFDEMGNINGKLLEQLRTNLLGDGNRLGAIGANFARRMEDAEYGLTRLAVKSTDLVGAFEKLGHFIREQLIQGYQNTLNNRSNGLTGAQTFFDEFLRIFQRGITDPGFSFVQTAGHLREAAEAGQSPMTLMTGRSIAEMSQQYARIQQSVEAQGHRIYDIFGGQDGWMKFVDTMTEYQKNTSVFGRMDAAQQAQQFSAMTGLLSQISRATGISADKLTDMLKASAQEVNDLQAIGMLNKQEGDRMTSALTQTRAMGPGGQELSKLFNDYVMNGRNLPQFIQSHPEMALPGMQPGMYQNMFEQMLRNNMSPSQIQQLIVSTNAQMQQNNAANNMSPQAMAAVIKEYPQLQAVLSSQMQLGTFNPKQPTLGPESDPLKTVAGAIQEFSQKFPIFSGAVTGFLGLVAQFGMHVAEFALAARFFGAGSLLGSAGSVLGGVARTAAVGLGAVAGAGVLGYQAYQNVSDANSGNSGRGVGGAIGGVIGGVIGTFTDFIDGPFGTIVGAAIGNEIGQWIGGKIAGPSGPAEGPAAAAAAQGVESSNGELLQANNLTNTLIMQTNAELAKQTALLGGAPASNTSQTYTSQGLAAAVPGAAAGASGNADAGTPYH